MTQLHDEQFTRIKGMVQDILVHEFELDQSQLTPDATLMALGLDSLDAIDLVITFQKRFDIRLEDRDVREIRCLQDIYVLLERYAVQQTH